MEGMSKTNQNTQYLFNSLHNTSAELIKLISSADSREINSVPFKNSWTAAQLGAHIIKSNKAIIQAMDMQGKTAQRDPGERKGELKSMFLDYKIKFQSPDFITPGQQIYEKSTLIADLKKSIKQLKLIIPKTDITEIISLPSFGEITKLELAWSVLYHTKRHIHQLKKIFASLSKNESFTEDKIQKGGAHN